MLPYIKTGKEEFEFRTIITMTIISKLWGTSEDGKIEYKSLTPEYLAGALKVMHKGFYPYESVSKAVGVALDEESVFESDELCKIAVKDGVSVIAVEKSSGNVVGALFNKIQVKIDGKETDFEAFARTCRRESSKRLVLFMKEADETCDLFELLNINCLMECMFLATLPEYGKRGIGKRLVETSVEVARQLASGNNVKVSTDGTVLNLEPRPKAVSALFTSPISRKIGKSLKWSVASTIDYNQIYFHGKSFSSLLKDSEAHSTLEYLKVM